MEHGHLATTNGSDIFFPFWSHKSHEMPLYAWNSCLSFWESHHLGTQSWSFPLRVSHPTPKIIFQPFHVLSKDTEKGKRHNWAYWKCWQSGPSTFSLSIDRCERGTDGRTLSVGNESLPLKRSRAFVHIAINNFHLFHLITGSETFSHRSQTKAQTSSTVQERMWGNRIIQAILVQ